MQNLMTPVNTPDKLFHDGDPTQGIEGTIVTAEFMNNHQAATRDLQQEVINVLKEAGVTPDPEKQNQLVEALTSFIGQKVPDASLTQKGVVQLNSAVNSESETEAAHQKRSKLRWITQTPDSQKTVTAQTSRINNCFWITSAVRRKRAKLTICP
ncbi:phage tail protein [Escherichia coli]|uniref:phage tail protein n=1 Tax=Escherichia coli TaxID=562 RepID=UPI003B27DE8B